MTTLVKSADLRNHSPVKFNDTWRTRQSILRQARGNILNIKCLFMTRLEIDPLTSRYQGKRSTNEPMRQSDKKEYDNL